MLMYFFKISFFFVKCILDINFKQYEFFFLFNTLSADFQLYFNKSIAYSFVQHFRLAVPSFKNKSFLVT